MRIVRNGEAFVVVDKPTGWLSVPSRMGEKESRPVVGRKLEEELGVRIWPCHRLDEEVSGLLLFAKNADAHRWASRLFEERRVTKAYEALTLEAEKGFGREAAKIAGSDISGGGLWESCLMRGKRRAYEHSEGKVAQTHALRLGSVEIEGQRATRWRLEPLTGRSHQLRFEMMKRVAPIWGDSLYGSQATWSRGGVALRSLEIAFDSEDHPEKFDLPLKIELEGF